MEATETIFALASARGRSGVAVVRVSGARAWSAAAALAGPLPEPRRAVLRTLRTAEGEAIDTAVVLLFAAGASFTGEPVAEFQVHGSAAVIAALLGALGAMPGLRPAEPGEFTRRALESGRLDLAQVEGLADLIAAETEAQRRQALALASGALGRRAEGWRVRLVRAAALLAATIDFADEDVPEDVMPEVRALIGEVAGELARELAGADAAERIREGFEVAIVGAPNAGKSTLLNALAGRDAALTSDVAGTTRDVIEVRMDIAGLPVTLLDTAGLRAAGDRVEAMGVARALERARAADLRVFLLGGEGDARAMLAPAPGDLVVRGKADLGAPDGGLAVSGLTGAGLGELVAAIGSRLEPLAAGAGLAGRARHRAALGRAAAALEAAAAEAARGAGRAELAAEELRRATGALESLVGRVDVEHLLDEIFASFCIGK